MRRITSLIACAGLAATAAVASTSMAAPTNSIVITAPAAAKAEIGKKAPAFKMKDLDGKEHSLADFKGKTVVLVGDLKHGRTVHSLAKMLAAFDVALVFVAPPELAMPAGVAAAVDAGTATRAEAPSLAAALVDADALYVTRVQKERFPDAAAYEAVRGSYVVDARLMKTAKPSCAVLHPLPRVDEISADFDSDPRAAYFRQMRNGLFARMALLDLVL